jgi:hypothetical protein
MNQNIRISKKKDGRHFESIRHLFLLKKRIEGLKKLFSLIFYGSLTVFAEFKKDR